MPGWLTPAWIDASTEVAGSWSPPAGDRPPPAPVILTVTVTGGPDGDATYERRWWADADDQADDRAGAARDLAVTLPAADARAVLDGELSPSVAFMRGRMKTSGDPGAVLDVLAAAATASFADLLARLRSITDS